MPPARPPARLPARPPPTALPGKRLPQLRRHYDCRRLPLALLDALRTKIDGDSRRVAERAEVVENWLKQDGVVIPAADANVEAADAELRLDPTSFFGSAPTRRVGASACWRRPHGDAHAPERADGEGDHRAGFPFYGLHLIERRADGDADAGGFATTRDAHRRRWLRAARRDSAAAVSVGSERRRRRERRRR